MVFVYVFLCNICMRTAVDQSQFQLLLARQSSHGVQYVKYSHKVDESSLQLISSGRLSVSPLALKTNKNIFHSKMIQVLTQYGRRTRCIISSLVRCLTSFLLDSTFFTSLSGRKQTRGGFNICCVTLQVSLLLTVHAVP